MNNYPPFEETIFLLCSDYMFADIKDEKSLDLLKRKIVRDPLLYKDFLPARDRVLAGHKKSIVMDKFSHHLSNGTAKMPSHAELLEFYKMQIEKGEEVPDERVFRLLRKLKVRSNSGVAVVSLLTKPYACPGRCIYCPTEKNMPKSYLAKEPAAARALMNKFDAYKQITTRLHALKANGHAIDKVEMILIGGTWGFYPKEYREEFVMECFRACNNYGCDLDKQTKKGEKTLSELQTINETSQIRIIGLSIETRPDYVTQNEIEHMRMLGVTKVEIGVQHVDDSVLMLTRREMTREAICEATELLRNAGFKIVYHMMPNLPGSDRERDVTMFSDLFSGKDFQPDMLKIYPCVVLKKTLLYKIWAKGGYAPYDDDTLISVLKGIYKVIPPYVRVLRMIRDIPATYIVASSKISNLREHVEEAMIKEGNPPRDIRAREVRDQEINPNDFEVITRTYKTRSGTEYFLSFENTKTDTLAAFVRLRLPDDKENPVLPILKNAGLVRELHTYGRLARIDKEGEQSQHMGFGKRLLLEAERITKEHGYENIAVISGVGVREYYKQRGYALAETYMVKAL